jgi:hypothetical protein
MGSTTSTMGPAGSAFSRSTERARFAPDPEVSTPTPADPAHPALAEDLGRGRALLMLIAPTTTRHAHDRLPWTA